jgi:putative transposase
MRKNPFVSGEYYHVYNRGTDKRVIFVDDQDFERFLQSMVEFNVIEPVGGLYVNSFRKNLLRSRTSKLDTKKTTFDGRLVEIIAYCLNPNHFHFVLKQISERCIEKFMQRLGTGYTKYFNHKYDRNGVLFQGKFKAIHIESNVYLLHVSAYVNLNFKVHKLRSPASKYRASIEEYAGGLGDECVCDKDSILGQFRNRKEYMEFAENSLRGTLERRGFLETSALLE